jgi:carboxylate-amine ligase
VPWATQVAERPWTVGIEEELMLLDPHDWTLANRISDVLAVLPLELVPRVSAETHACVVELKTAYHASVTHAAAELSSLRQILDGVLREELYLRAAAAGTHPLATQSEVSVSPVSRYRKVGATMRVLARREPTMALHVHVAVPNGAAAVRALDGLRFNLPVLLALSANSPFWRASDSGFASVRTPIFSMFPRVGIPRQFGTYDNYIQVVGELLQSGAIPDPSFLWWDARLQPRFGTVEVRIMDAQSKVADAAGLAAVVQCLVRRYAEDRYARGDHRELLAENRFLAARDGVRGQLIDERTGQRRPTRDAVAELLEGCRPYAASLGCTAELVAASTLAADPGEARQRRLAARHGLASLPSRLSDRFVPAEPCPGASLRAVRVARSK